MLDLDFEIEWAEGEASICGCDLCDNVFGAKFVTNPGVLAMDNKIKNENICVDCYRSIIQYM